MSVETHLHKEHVKMAGEVFTDSSGRRWARDPGFAMLASRINQEGGTLRMMRDPQDTLVAAWDVEERALHCPVPCAEFLLRIARRLREWYEDDEKCFQHHVLALMGAPEEEHARLDADFAG